MKQEKDLRDCDCDRCAELLAACETIMEYVQETLTEIQANIAETVAISSEISKQFVVLVRTNWQHRTSKMNPKELDEAVRKMKEGGRDS